LEFIERVKKFEKPRVKSQLDLLEYLIKLSNSNNDPLVSDLVPLFSANADNHKLLYPVLKTDYPEFYKNNIKSILLEIILGNGVHLQRVVKFFLQDDQQIVDWSPEYHKPRAPFVMTWEELLVDLPLDPDSAVVSEILQTVQKRLRKEQLEDANLELLSSFKNRINNMRNFLDSTVINLITKMNGQVNSKKGDVDDMFASF
jgi:hypothetical protein